MSPSSEQKARQEEWLSEIYIYTSEDQIQNQFSKFVHFLKGTALPLNHFLKYMTPWMMRTDTPMEYTVISFYSINLYLRVHLFNICIIKFQSREMNLLCSSFQTLKMYFSILVIYFPNNTFNYHRHVTMWCVVPWVLCVSVSLCWVIPQSCSLPCKWFH